MPQLVDKAPRRGRRALSASRGRQRVGVTVADMVGLAMVAFVLACVIFAWSATAAETAVGAGPADGRATRQNERSALGLDRGEHSW